MTTYPGRPVDSPRQMWARGDYDLIARSLLGTLGPDLVRAADVRSGHRVLDVAAGTGNATLPAASTGAEVTGCDVTPELMAVGERNAEAAGLRVRWVEADVQDLPFETGEFDVVLSSIGAMFAPDQDAAAHELLRVCRPGGTLAMANWPPGGAVERFFGVLSRYSPPPPDGSRPVTRWGDPHGVHELLGGGTSKIETTLRAVVGDFAGTPEEWVELYTSHFAPVIVVAEQLDPRGRTALADDLLAFAREERSARREAPGRYVYEYLQVVSTRS